MYQLNAPEAYSAKIEALLSSHSIVTDPQHTKNTLKTILAHIKSKNPEIDAYKVDLGNKDASTVIYKAPGEKAPLDDMVLNAAIEGNSSLIITTPDNMAFSLSVVRFNDKDYIQFMSPEAAKAALIEEKQTLNTIPNEFSRELTFFEKLCDKFAQWFLDRRGEAAARKEAYEEFYRSMSESIQKREELLEHSQLENHNTAVRDNNLYKEKVFWAGGRLIDVEADEKYYQEHKDPNADAALEKNKQEWERQQAIIKELNERDRLAQIKADPEPKPEPEPAPDPTEVEKFNHEMDSLKDQLKNATKALQETLKNMDDYQQSMSILKDRITEGVAKVKLLEPKVEGLKPAVEASKKEVEKADLALKENEKQQQEEKAVRDADYSKLNDEQAKLTSIKETLNADKIAYNNAQKKWTKIQEEKGAIVEMTPDQYRNHLLTQKIAKLNEDYYQQTAALQKDVSEKATRIKNLEDYLNELNQVKYFANVLKQVDHDTAVRNTKETLEQLKRDYAPLQKGLEQQNEALASMINELVTEQNKAFSPQEFSEISNALAAEKKAFADVKAGFEKAKAALDSKNEAISKQETVCNNIAAQLKNKWGGKDKVSQTLLDEHKLLSDNKTTAQQKLQKDENALNDAQKELNKANKDLKDNRTYLKSNETSYKSELIESKNCAELVKKLQDDMIELAKKDPAKQQEKEIDKGVINTGM